MKLNLFKEKYLKLNLEEKLFNLNYVIHLFHYNHQNKNYLLL